MSYKGYALFDLDQTLVPWDMQLLYANWVFNKFPERRIYLLLFIGALPLFKVLGARRMKRLFLAILHGLTPQELADINQSFISHYLPSLLYPEVLQRLKEHQKAGDCVILTSASPSLYVPMIGHLLGVDKTFCSEIPNYPTMPLIPEFVRGNNKEEVKIINLKAWLEEQSLSIELPLPNSIAYTDSTADLPLIRSAEKAVLVNPSTRLIQETERLGLPFEVLTPKRPFKTKGGKIIAATKLFLGIYPI